MIEHFDYYQDGYFILKKRQFNGSKLGQRVGWLQPNGYWRISIKRKSYQAHRLIWLFHYGVLPKQDIDHINGNKSDNRICNLRDIAHNLNNQNTIKPRKNNKCNVLGVSRVGNKFSPNIFIDGKRKYLGAFDDIELAELVYQEAKRKYHMGYTL